MGLDISVKDTSGNTLLDERLGNVGYIGRVQKMCAQYPDIFKVINQQVIYSPCHCGDEIEEKDLPMLLAEAETLLAYPFESDDRDKESVKEFAQKLINVCRIALSSPGAVIEFD
jgi:hypothetical protein